MGKKFKRISIITISLIFIALIGMMIFSPYKKTDRFSYKAIASSIEINVSTDSVFNYLGKSQNASKWSVFVAKIKPLNANIFPDGSVGSRRRCYSSKNSEMIWDEHITEIIPNKKRQLLIYNMENFPVSASHLATEQIYESIGKNKCRLTFTLFYKDYNPNWFETLKTHFASYKVKSVFEQNLNNIKEILE